MNTPATPAPKDLVGFLDFYLVKQAPFQIPDGGREWIVKFGPWITVVLLILTLPILLFALGLGVIFIPFGGVGYASGFGMLTLFVIVEVGPDDCRAAGTIRAQDGGMAAALLLAAREHRLQHSERARGICVAGRVDRALHPVSGAAVVSPVTAES